MESQTPSIDAERKVSRRRSFRERASLNALALVMGIATAFSVGEILVRVLDLPPHPLASLGYQNFALSDDPILRYEYQHGYSGPMDAGYIAFPVNANGFRDHIYPKTKPAGITRIVLLGDSITAGNGVPDLEMTFAKHLERQMNTGLRRGRIEVMNMAVGGYNTTQEAEYLRVRGLAYHPDVVAVCFCVNDFMWTSDGSVQKKLKAQLAEKGAGRFARIASAPDSLATAILRHSRFAFALSSVCSGLLDLGARRVVVADYEMNSDNPVELGLQMLRRLQEQNGFRAILFVVPGLNKPFSQYAHGAIHERLRASVARAYPTLAVVDLLESLRNEMDNPSSLTYDGLHLTEEGHRVMANHIQRPLEASLGIK